MAYYTKAQARAAAKSDVNRGRVLDSVNESLESYRDTDRFDIFLSHSINDRELVVGVKKLLEDQGYKVYVDWVVDKNLERAKVDKQTAEILRKRMKQSTSLVYIATENASNSKWMPWELGYFDGRKTNGVAILPLLDSENQPFAGQEYLSLYPVVSKSAPNGQERIYVEDKENAWTYFEGFAKGKPSWNSYKR